MQSPVSVPRRAMAHVSGWKKQRKALHVLFFAAFVQCLAPRASRPLWTQPSSLPTPYPAAQGNGGTALGRALCRKSASTRRPQTCCFGNCPSRAL
jgi:hypothetical protein